MKKIKRWFWATWLWISGPFISKEVLYFKSPDFRYIYFVVMGKRCPDVETLLDIFPEAVRISEARFHQLQGQGSKVVLVADGHIADTLEPEDEEPIQQPLQSVK